MSCSEQGRLVRRSCLVLDLACGSLLANAVVAQAETLEELVQAFAPGRVQVEKQAGVFEVESRVVFELALARTFFVALDTAVHQALAKHHFVSSQSAGFVGEDVVD